MKLKNLLIAGASLFLTGSLSQAQCTWQNVLTDGFEYTTVCPNLVPGTTIHNTPQQFAVYSGSYSLYMNFVNCVGGTGTCPGAKVYERGFAVCRNQPVRFSAWLTTAFSGTQCNVRITVKDGNGAILNDQLNIAAPYAPQWIQYTSGSVTPVTDSVVFIMYTNVGGGNGNDLSMDDFVLEKCVGGGHSTTTTSMCDNDNPVDLFNLLPGTNITTGVWSGPSLLSGGYLGTFDPLTGTPGNYVYENPWFGTLPGCPMAYDTVNVQLNPAPVVNLGTDTTLCTNQTLMLSAGSTPGYTYLWQNGVTGPNQFVFTNSTVDTTITYWVQVTNPSGCSSTDTLVVNFVVCSGVGEPGTENTVSVFPVPASDEVTFLFDSKMKHTVRFVVYSVNGLRVQEGIADRQVYTLPVQNLEPGVYTVVFSTPGLNPINRKLLIRN